MGDSAQLHIAADSISILKPPSSAYGLLGSAHFRQVLILLSLDSPLWWGQISAIRATSPEQKVNI